MHMKKSLLLLLLPLSIIFSSCNETVDPVTYNDNLVKTSELSEKRLEVIDNQIDTFFDSEEFSAEESANLIESIKVAKDSIQSDFNKVQAMKKPANADEFHNATLSYIESLITQLTTYKEEYSKLSNDMSDEDYKKMDDVLNKSLENTQNKLDEMIKAQTAFAKTSKLQLTN